MNRVSTWRSLSLICSLLLLVTASLNGAEPVSPAPGNELLREYFRLRTNAIEEDCLADVKNAEDWNSQREARHLELREMLGLSPWPEKTPLQPIITGTAELDDFVVEKLHFQSQPGLYVTANLYRPRTVEKPLPAILYVCGHANVKENGVPMGNKTGYQHHGAWYARNGYVCLTIDTIQLGEIAGTHHGTHQKGMWWWLNRGYTPAGVEAWNGIRAIDYLQSRPEVDPERIGVTGRSGGGAYSWYIAALDDRIKAAAPVAGITNMDNHIVDKCINGHCDCMFMVNRYGWDFPMLAAMVAPRPLLIINTDRDSIFPLDGVVDVHVRVRKLYQLLKADKNTGLFLCMGPHADSQHLQNASFQWFNLHLKKEDQPITVVAEKLFKPAELKVFEQLPADEKVTTAHDWFNKPATRGDDAANRTYNASRIGLVAPQELNVKLVKTHERDGLRLRTYEFDSEKPYRLPFYVIDAGEATSLDNAVVEVLTPDQMDSKLESLKAFFVDESAASDAVDGAKKWLSSKQEATVLFAPRGVGATRWDEDAKTNPHTRRSFNLLGTTEDERRGIDTANALAAVRSALKVDGTQVKVVAKELPAFWSLYAALVTSQPGSFYLHDLAINPHEDGPFILALEQQTSLPELVLQAAGVGHRLYLSAEINDQHQDWIAVQEKARKQGIQTLNIGDQTGK
ncbi:MAG TPA: acetylxylan esterase [Planctomicrobium sp.]|nr:acetylxylan esterase [Planctomicrobium sp.]